MISTSDFDISDALNSEEAPSAITTAGNRVLKFGARKGSMNIGTRGPAALDDPTDELCPIAPGIWHSEAALRRVLSRNLVCRSLVETAALRAVESRGADDGVASGRQDCSPHSVCLFA